jgi:hypothetical protein
MSELIFSYARFKDRKPELPESFRLEDLQPNWTSDEQWLLTMQSLQMEPTNPQETTKSAYMHLRFVEDIIAIHCDGPQTVPELCETWLAQKWEESKSEMWKDLVSKAWQTDVCSEAPSYFRPSLCLLSSEWMKANGFENNPATSVDSLTFAENPSLVQVTYQPPYTWNASYSD